MCYTKDGSKKDCMSVCDYGWSNSDARVACKELNCSSEGKKTAIKLLKQIVNIAGAHALHGLEFEDKEEVKYCVAYVNCEGDEESLFACKLVLREKPDQNERAGVNCPGYFNSCVTAFRLFFFSGSNDCKCNLNGDKN